MEEPKSPQTSKSWCRVAGVLARVALGLFFLYSGGAKLFVVGLSAFVDAVGNYQLVGAPWDAVVAYVLPWVEIFAGLALVLGIAQRGGALVLAGMLIFFNIALALAWSSGLEINCGCHGVSDTPTNYPIKIITNFGLLGIALSILFSGRDSCNRVEPPVTTISTT